MKNKTHTARTPALFRPGWLALPLLCILACGNPNAPLDADTRQAIDSISSAHIRQARESLDSTCKTRRATELPRLVDSIKQQRLQEIREQLKTVPR